MDFGITLAHHDVKMMYIGQIFQWLSNGVSSLASTEQSFGELGAVVSTRSLAHYIYSLLKSSGDGEPSVTKSDLHLLRDTNFAWPTEMCVNKIPALPNNIAKNFM